VATFDSSIIGEDTSCAKPPNNGPTVEAMLPAASQNNGSLAERLTSSQCENDMHMNATHSSAKKDRVASRSSYSYTQSLMGNAVRQPRGMLNLFLLCNICINCFLTLLARYPEIFMKEANVYALL